MIKDKEPTILSQFLSITDQISHYDASSKRLLSHKFILAFILKACIPAYREHATMISGFSLIFLISKNLFLFWLTSKTKSPFRQDI